MLKYLKSRNIL